MIAIHVVLNGRKTTPLAPLQGLHEARFCFLNFGSHFVDDVVLIFSRVLFRLKQRFLNPGIQFGTIDSK